MGEFCKHCALISLIILGLISVLSAFGIVDIVFMSIPLNAVFIFAALYCLLD